MSGTKWVVCIGTSTGGPGALQKVLTKLPQSFPSPLFIVQHMPPKFTKALAERLDHHSSIRVKEAEDGEMAQAGTAYIAPGGFQMTVSGILTGIQLCVRSGAARAGHCPSVNELFDSAAKLKNFKKLAVIMTGMGSDGAEGLKALVESGNTYVVAESAASAVVFGMPRAAIETIAVNEVLHVEEIGACLTDTITRSQRS
ncbi:MAG TPA: CheB methylesterase domain-containing protein [Bacillales bacterium]|nr:CheB methylesterase domain-containing protein [Bacillales bacterium]